MNPGHIDLTRLLRCPATHAPLVHVPPDRFEVPGRDRSYLMRDGYLDIVGLSTRRISAAQRLMESRCYARGYETYRPALTKIATRQTVDDSITLSVSMLQPLAGCTVLDVACGTGNFTRPIAREVGTDGLVVGLDLSETMLQNAVVRRDAEGLSQIEYVRADAHHLPFVAAAFDRVHCTGAIHLMPNPRRVLDEFRRVIRPSGHIVIGTFVRTHRLRMAFVENLAEPLTGFSFFEQTRFEQLLHGAGFEIREQLIEEGACQVSAIPR